MKKSIFLRVETIPIHYFHEIIINFFFHEHFFSWIFFISWKKKYGLKQSFWFLIVRCIPLLDRQGAIERVADAKTIYAIQRRSLMSAMQVDTSQLWVVMVNLYWNILFTLYLTISKINNSTNYWWIKWSPVQYLWVVMDQFGNFQFNAPSMKLFNCWFFPLKNKQRYETGDHLTNDHQSHISMFIF